MEGTVCTDLYRKIEVALYVWHKRQGSSSAGRLDPWRRRWELRILFFYSDMYFAIYKQSLGSAYPPVQAPSDVGRGKMMTPFYRIRSSGYWAGK